MSLGDPKKKGVDIIEKNNLPKRKELRIPEYNYSAEGAYFITICTKDRKNLLSEIKYIKDIPKINLLYPGIVVKNYINSINNTYQNLKITNFIIMPNHIHMICIISYENIFRVAEDVDPYKCKNTSINFCFEKINK